MVASAFAADLGARLRHVREAMGISLSEVESRSRGRFTAAAVGTYERGERNVTAHRLAILVSLYQVPVESVLPPLTDPTPDEAWTPPEPGQERSVVLNLDAVSPGVDIGPLARYAAVLQSEHNGSQGTITLSGRELGQLAIVYELPPEELLRRFIAWGLI